MISEKVKTKNSYQANVTLSEERFNKRIALLTEEKRRTKLFELGAELAKQGVSRDEITDDIMLKGYDKQMRLAKEGKELVRKRPFINW